MPKVLDNGGGWAGVVGAEEACVPDMEAQSLGAVEVGGGVGGRGSDEGGELSECGCDGGRGRVRGVKGGQGGLLEGAEGGEWHNGRVGQDGQGGVDRDGGGERRFGVEEGGEDDTVVFREGSARDHYGRRGYWEVRWDGM